jgi:hypothetical protein
MGSGQRIHRSNGKCIKYLWTILIRKFHQEQDNTKMDPIKNSDTGMCSYSYGSGQGNVHILWKGNDPLGSIKGKQLLDKLSNWLVSPLHGVNFVVSYCNEAVRRYFK